MGLYDFFSRVLVPVRQRPSSTDLNRLQDYIAQTMQWARSEVFAGAFSGDPTEVFEDQSRMVYPVRGFFGGSFFTMVNGAFTVQVRPGIGASPYAAPASATDIDGTSGTDWESSLGAPLVLSAAENLTVPAPPAVGSSRIDIIEVRADYLAGSPATVGIFNAATRVFDPTVKNKRLHWDLSGRTGSAAPGASTAPISYVTGVVAVGTIAAATEPATTAGYVKIARINLDCSAGAVAAVTQDMIADLRPKIYPGGMIHAGGRITIAGTVAGIAATAVTALELPPGVTAKMTFANNVPPAAGTSYTAAVYLFGGDIRPRTLVGGYRGSVALTPLGAVAPRTVNVSASGTGVVTSALSAILAGTDANYTTINPEVLAVGQPYYSFSFEVQHPAAAALSANEAVFFQALLGQG